jgi:hypothetical protein
MNRRVSEKLIRNLSLYLDNELSKEEIIEIEELLKIDQEVSEIFDSLKKTRLVLRNAPRIKRRRSFMLSPEHAKQVRKESGFLNGMRLVSTFSMILLLVVFTQNMLGGWSPLNNILMGASNSAEDTIAMNDMEFSVQDAAVEKASDFVDDTFEDESAERDVAAPEVAETEVEDCSVEDTSADAQATDSADEALEEGETVISPEDVTEGEDIPTEDVLNIGGANLTEEAATEDAVDTSEDQSDSYDDAEESAELAEEIESVEQDSADYAATEFVEDVDEGQNPVLLIVLAVITALSSGTYLFLRKKFS